MKISAQNSLLLGCSLVLCIFILTSRIFDIFIGDLRKNLYYPKTTKVTKSAVNESTVPPPKIEAKRVFQKHIEIGEILPNCGLPQACPDESFALHLFSGDDKDDEPRLCVLGKYVIGSGINNGGRGINVALVEPVHFQIVSVKNFDTYSKDSADLEAWLQNEILSHDIIIFFTFDEASKELGSLAKKLLYELGSYKVQDLHFRSQWFMITQKGINGFTPYETLNFAKNNHWADAINIRLCVPRKITGQVISPDPLPHENSNRVKFCKKHKSTGYEDFCRGSLQHEPISAAMLTNRSLIGNPVYAAPILVLPSPSPASVLLTFESLTNQPGINPSNVLVFHYRNQTEILALTKLFKYRGVPVGDTMTRVDKMEYGFKLLKENYPDKKYVIVIEEDLILSPDFLFYMAQIMPLLEKDQTLLGISAWNPNGFEEVSSNGHLAYRVEEFPGVGFLIPMLVYTNYLEGNFEKCCISKPWHNWPDIVKKSGGHMIIPDVSRVFLPISGSGKSLDPVLSTLRVANLDVSAYIEKPQDLEKDKYFQKLASLIQDSIPLHMSKEDLVHCKIGKSLMTSKIFEEYSNKTFAVYFKEEDVTLKGTKLMQIANCFGVPATIKPRALYKHLLRLTVSQNTVLLVEATSPFFKAMPRTVQPL